MQLPQYLAEQQVSFETLVHPPAYTSPKRAKYLHLSGRHVAKSILLVGPKGYLLAVLPSTRHIKMDSLEQAEGGPLRLASGREIATVFRDCEWGVVPPFGTPYGVRVYLDNTVSAEDWLVFEGTSHVEAFRMRCKDFERLEQPKRLEFAYED